MGGFIKLHRKILDWEWYDDITTYRLFTHLLLSANYEDKKWHGEVVKRGSYITSYASLVRETGLSKKQIERAMKNLMKTGEVEKVTSKKNTLIIVTNYNLYQDVEKQKEQQGEQEGETQENQNFEKNQKKEKQSELQNTQKGESDEQKKHAYNRDNFNLCQEIGEEKEKQEGSNERNGGCFKGEQHKNIRNKEVKNIRNKELNNTLAQSDKIASVPSVIELPLNDNSMFPIEQSDLDEWQELYPAVNVMQELRKMKGWLNSNPTKRKTKRGIKRFVNSWLSRQQDKGYVSKQTNANVNSTETNNPFLAMLGDDTF